MDDVYVAESAIHGAGVFAAREFAAGETVLRMDDSRVVDAEHPLRPELGEYEYHCDYLEGGEVVLQGYPERHVNSSCDPNAYARRGAARASSSRGAPSGGARRSPATTSSTATAASSGAATAGARAAAAWCLRASSSCPSRRSWSTCPCSTTGSSRSTARRSRRCGDSPKEARVTASVLRKLKPAGACFAPPPVRALSGAAQAVARVRLKE